jgi:hypothetical protein
MFEQGGGKRIAGPGSAPLEQADRLASQYGGKPENYEKITSGVIAQGSDGTKVQVHAYRNIETGKIYEDKFKVFPGKE